MENKTKSMIFLDNISNFGIWIEFLIGILVFFFLNDFSFSFIDNKGNYNYRELIKELFQAGLAGIFTAILIGSIDYIKNIYKKLEALRRIEKNISREVVSLQYGNINRLNSEIIIGLLQKNEPLSNFLINELDFKPTNTLTQKILDEFLCAKSKSIAKACCVINDRKFIEISKKDLNQSSEMLKYFIQHKEVTDGNLIISRIFSFPFENINNQIKISVSNHDYIYILYLYLIANYYSGVHTYLHLYNCQIGSNSACEFNDYVSLMVYDKEASYKTFIAPANYSTSSLLTISDDLMLAQALEKDFKRKLNKQYSVDLTAPYANYNEGFIKIKPENFKIIHTHLGLEESKTKIKNSLLLIIKDIEDETKKEYKKAINQFLL
jgi:hypothetical protein